MLFLSRYSRDGENYSGIIASEVDCDIGKISIPSPFRPIRICEDHEDFAASDQGVITVVVLLRRKIQGCLNGIYIPLEDSCHRNLSHLVSHTISY